jgi:exodeoxyribonuclease VII large subunit
MADAVHTVAGITSLIRERLEGDFSGIWIEGEISNHRLPGSGHHYFTLKDPFAQLACVLFKGAAMKSPVRLTDGMQVQIFGSISVYEARGQYQMIAQVVQAKGFGDLQARFEALKRKLEAEGLFDPANKKKLPTFPATIGIVTSPTGAAIRDMLNVFARRAPWIRVIVSPVRVQGDGAATEIAEAIRHFDGGGGIPRPDLVILARGGGSIEDLWAFNEEVVARAIADCSIPVMSGVGHEIDFTIADFVADRREPTPSAAAENATPDATSLQRHLARLLATVETQTDQGLARYRRHLQSLARELAAREPGRKIQGWAQSIDYLMERMDSVLSGRLSLIRTSLASTHRILNAVNPEKELLRSRARLDEVMQSLEQVVSRKMADQSQKVRHLGSLMQSLSPDGILKRGFSLTTDESGCLITDASKVKTGDRLRTRLADGELTSVVES